MKQGIQCSKCNGIGHLAKTCRTKVGRKFSGSPPGSPRKAQANSVTALGPIIMPEWLEQYNPDWVKEILADAYDQAKRAEAM